LLDGQIVGKIFERILYHLYPGERKIFRALMHQGTGQHAAYAALAFFGVHQKVSLGSGYGGYTFIQPDQIGQDAYGPGPDGGVSGEPQKVPAGKFLFFSSFHTLILIK
jgi:hypothetical protein